MVAGFRPFVSAHLRQVSHVGLLMAVAGMGTTSPPADLSGRVAFNGIGVPGATVAAERDDRKLTTVTSEDGAFRFAPIDTGSWTVRVTMRGFVSQVREVEVPAGAGVPHDFSLELQPFDDIMRGATGAVGVGASSPLSASLPDDTAVINGSVVNGAATPFAQPRAFGNNRPNLRPAYSVTVNVLGGHSSLNARPYSFAATPPPAPRYGDLHFGGQVSGPLRIPWLVSNGPQVNLAYQHSVSHRALAQSALMPTVAQRQGDFSSSGAPLVDPVTRAPFANNSIPDGRISPQARALLDLFPVPNAETAIGANFQRATLTRTTDDRGQFSIQKSIGRRDSLVGALGVHRSSAETTSLFGFTDRATRLVFDVSSAWTHRFTTRVSARLRYQLTRTSATTTPYFSYRADISGDAGIEGNDRAPENWGPPALLFPDVADLRSVLYDRTVSYAHALGAEVLSNRGRHHLSLGADVKLMAVHVTSQQDPRGTLTFTGAMTGHAFGDFLLGLPSTASIAIGNADKRLRGTAYDVFVNDDWRVNSALTLNLGVRWEYESPFAEGSRRLVNLDLSPDFSTARPVAARLRRDWRGLQPRLGASWRPIPASTLVIRAGYGQYRNTGVYQPLAMLLSQQPPFSRTYSLQASAATPLTIGNAFTQPAAVVTNTAAVDPDLRVGVVHTWQLSIQRELPADLTVTAAYLGSHGSRLLQASLPNTNPPGATDPCASCPRGFVYLSSGGSSRRHALQLVLRRRLRNGLTASVDYTWSAATDDAATFASGTAASPATLAIAQDWRDLRAERGPSSFDQPHLVQAQFEFTSGVGVTGGTLVDGFWGSLYKDWTVSAHLNAGSGLPVTPVYFVTVPGTGLVGIRPRATGSPARYSAPDAGRWGDAGRNSLRGPRQFSLDASIARTFRLGEKRHLDYRLQVDNILNRVTFSAINRVVGSPQFGLPIAANAMRRLHMSLRLRF